MAEVYHRYLGKNGKIPEPTAEQKKREASDARLSAAKAREREAIAALREAELARKRGELVETAIVTREAQDVCIVIRSRLLLLPTQLARKCVGKSQHETRMIIDSGIREALTELSNLTSIRHRKRKAA
jgi:phage terminase Nu1 subunit (DNA packaging protein)